ncbi:DNA ligase-associated DEXH box helicase [Sandarakinorhabdus cyanobacteriorum]|uniref:DNA ligase-associated DEXH box helicase n=1 Tax=Sandarakinorhabdus cyanobacteriorum TaxID=1981098 RepID=A0A255YLK3_9SPHN|nr:ligase-associated DNA damage response exonuclease [Sandarakinorhabdus cyanobacteriorum]OYQ30073.1 DNA ligase-associated DEXH box helicase [Sandarakinorhabdus cyanobacteriorum]
MPNPDWIIPHGHGLYLPGIDTWIDPGRAVDRAIITHGHADHARAGHTHVLATAETLAIMAQRFGPQAGGQALAYGQRLALGDGITVHLLPAGHVLGSAQIVLEKAGTRLIVSGDYKRRADPTCPPFEPLPCDIFITEATFGLPVLRHPDTASEIAKLLGVLAANPDRCVAVGAYALGKAQRVIAELRRAGHDAPIYLHGAMTALCALYQAHGVALGDLRPVGTLKGDALKGSIIIAPPSALRDVWSRRLPDPVTAMASGWMRVRQRAVQSGIELPLIISDHADWDELTTTIADLNPGEVWVTHGREEALMHWCALNQRRARALALVGRDDEGD